jgi:hypothetical protein
MKLALLAFCCIVTTFTSFSQKFAYSFEGVLNSTIIQELESEISNLENITSCKIKMKDTSKGEVFFEIKYLELRAEGQEQFSPVDVKRILLEKSLMPLNFIELK